MTDTLLLCCLLHVCFLRLPHSYTRNEQTAAAVKQQQAEPARVKAMKGCLKIAKHSAAASLSNGA